MTDILLFILDINVLGKEEVVSSNLIVGSTYKVLIYSTLFFLTIHSYELIKCNKIGINRYKIP